MTAEFIVYYLVLCTEWCSTKLCTQSDLHTPSFLSLSRAPCRKSKETSSFSSSHCITNCSNHLQGRKDSKLQQGEEHPNPSKPCESCQMSECCCPCLQSKFPNILAPVRKLLVNRACTITWAGSELFLSFFLSFLFVVSCPSIHVPESTRETSTPTGTYPVLLRWVYQIGHVRIGKQRSSFSDGIWQLVPLSSSLRDTHSTKGGGGVFIACV